MIKTKKYVFYILLGVLVLLALIYFESDEFQFHRLIVALIGLIEGVFFVQIIEVLDKKASEKQWTSSKALRIKMILSLGLIVFMICIDRLINFILTHYNMEYEIVWTIITPGSFLLVTVFKILDLWAYKYENRA